MANDHARHADWSRKRSEAEQFKANAEWYRPGGAHGEVEDPPEIQANRGLFADSGGTLED